MKKRNSVVLFGHLGQGNLGDEVMLAGLLSQLEADDIVLVAGNCSNLDFLPSGVKVQPRRLIVLLRAICKARALVFVGGTHVASFPRNVRHLQGILRQLVITLFAHFSGCAVVMAGIGVGPLQTSLGRFLAGFLFRSCSFISVRDDSSLTLLQSLNVPGEKVVRTVDPAWGLSLPDVERQTDCLGLSLMPYFANYFPSSAEDQRIIEAAITLIERWLAVSPTAKVRIVPFLDQPSRFSDLAVCKPVMKAFSSEPRVLLVSSDLSLEYRLEALGSCSHFISFRYHSMMLAHFYGIPQLAVCYHQKNRLLGAEIALSSRDMFTVQDFMDGKLSAALPYLREQASDSSTEARVRTTAVALSHLLPPFLRQI